MEVFVVLMWFYEGDSNLVDSFVGIKRTYEEALALLDGDDPLSDNDFYETEDGKRPNEWGGYGDYSRFEIRKIII